MKTAIPYVLAIVFLLLFLRQCDRTREVSNESYNTLEYLQDSVRYYQNKLGQEIAIKTALHGDKESLELLLSNSESELRELTKKFKNIQAAGQVKTITKIDTIHIGYEIPVPFEFDRSWSKNDRFYSITGKSTQDGITINSLEIPNTLSFVAGKKKGNFIIEAVNSNPHIKTTGLDAYSFKLPKKRFGLSIIAGYGMSDSGLSPLVGFGLGYNLIEF